jgi:hypothetical protein
MLSDTLAEELSRSLLEAKSSCTPVPSTLKGWTDHPHQDRSQHYGDPLSAVVWLTNHSGEVEEVLSEGSIVLTGGLQREQGYRRKLGSKRESETR